jgi:hypothetical protein
MLSEESTLSKHTTLGDDVLMFSDNATDDQMEEDESTPRPRNYNKDAEYEYEPSDDDVEDEPFKTPLPLKKHARAINVDEESETEEEFLVNEGDMVKGTGKIPKKGDDARKRGGGERKAGKVGLSPTHGRAASTCACHVLDYQLL